MNRNNVKQQGQVGLIVLLIAAVILTVGISVASRSVSETRITKEAEEQAQSLSVAEAGIEEVLDELDTLSPGVDHTISVGGGNDAIVQINPSGELTGVVVHEGHSVEYDMTGAGPADSLTIGWSGGNPAFVVTFISDNGQQVFRQAYDSVNARGNNFQYQAGPTFAVTVPAGFNNPKVARIKVLYDTTAVSVSPTGWTVADQFYTVDSKAVTTGTSNISVQLTKTLPQLPSIFDYVLFSGTALEKTP